MTRIQNNRRQQRRDEIARTLGKTIPEKVDRIRDIEQEMEELYRRHCRLREEANGPSIPLAIDRLEDAFRLEPKANELAAEAVQIVADTGDTEAAGVLSCIVEWFGHIVAFREYIERSVDRMERG